MEAVIRREVLINAYTHNGKADVGSVMKKVLGSNPEYRSKSKEVLAIVKKLVAEVNQLPYERITQLLQQEFPGSIQQLEEKKKTKTQEKKRGLPDLPQAETGKVVLRYAPDPSKYPHIGHALNYMINELYREKYKGKAFLRFDDTNPQKVATEFYDAIRDGMEWVGCKWDKEIIASTKMELFYDYAKTLISNSHLYVCQCDIDTMRKNREQMVECSCRNRSVEENLELFDQMVEGHIPVGVAVVRLKGDMRSKNAVMRDPVMFRLIDPQKTPHPIVGDKFWLWPTYDFESSVLEKELGITHVLRSAEFGTMRIELQSYLITLLGGHPPVFHQYSRFKITGAITKGREIRELVERGIVTGWDDIRLVTISGLKNRGIVPEVIKDLVLEIGITATNATIDWKKIETFNRRHLDETAPRLFAALDPIRIKVDNSPVSNIVLRYHPTNDSLGERTLSLGDVFHISRSDISSLSLGDVFRLKDLFNVRITNITDTIVEVDYAGKELIPNTRKVQWVPESHALSLEYTIPHSLINPDGSINESSLELRNGVIEDSITAFEEGSLFQLERIGFAKLNKRRDRVIYMHEIHK